VSHESRPVTAIDPNLTKEMLMNRLVLIFTLAITVFFLSPGVFGMRSVPGASGTANAQEDWKKEFEELCAGTQNSGELAADELKKLIDRCDKLKTRIEKLDETQRKVYLKRLQMCHDLYVFMLESKDKK
jgi:hypothetical protein